MADDFLLKLLENMQEDIKDIRSDVSDLLSFKWKIIGGTVLASLLLTCLFQISLIFLEKKL